MIGFTEQTPTPPLIDSLSEQELRRETAERINTVLGKLPAGPLADGTGLQGHQRNEQSLPNLRCSYFQFSKAFEGERQVGVQIALLGVFGSTYLGSYRSVVNKQLREKNLSAEENAELDRTIKKLRQLEESIAKDGIAPADNRYYFIPQDPIQPAIVSTESLIARAHRVNPQAAESILLPELIAEARNVDNQPIDEVSKQPRSKIANLQDLRDALALTRNGDWFVEEIIERTPKKYWGRPGLTY